MISKIALDKDTRKAVMAIVTKQAEIDWKDLAQYAGYGGAGGALLGGVSDYAMSDEKDPKKRLRNALHSAITTGLLGATAGAGAYGGQTLIPGMESPAVTLHGAPKVPDHPTTGSSENIANLASTGAVAATGSGMLKDIKDWKDAEKLKTTFGNIHSGDGKALHETLQKGIGPNVSPDAALAAQAAYDDHVAKLSGGSRGKAVINMFDTIEQYTPKQLKAIAQGAAPSHQAAFTPEQEFAYRDAMNHFGSPTARAGSNAATLPSQQKGLSFMNWLDNGAAHVAGKAGGAGNALAHAMSSSTLRRGIPTFGASIAANTIDSLLRNNGKVQN